MTERLSDATAAIERMRLELEAKGYRPRLVTVALERAQGAARRQSQVLSAAIQGQGYYDLLTHELRGAESWIQKCQAAIDDAHP